MEFLRSTAWHLSRRLSIFWKEVVFGFCRRTFRAISFLLYQLNATAPVLGSNVKPTIFAVLNLLYFLGHFDGLAKARGTFARTLGEKVH